MLRVLALLVALTGTMVRSECGVPVFRSDAQSMVTKADFESKFRRGEVVYNYKVIEIEYQPFMMVEDSDCIEESQLNLEVKTGAGDWVAVDSRPEALGGGKYKWKVDAVPCKNHMIRFWMNGPGGSESLEYEKPILAAAEEDIIRFGFDPATPTGLKVNNAGDNQLEVAWEPVECATGYEISYGKDISSMQSKIVDASQGSQLHLDSLDACTRYEISVYAVIGRDLYSAEAATYSFITQPEVSSALSLTPQIDRDTNYVNAQWQAFDKLSCVQEYQVSVCKEGANCLGEEKVPINVALNYIEYSMDGLEQCTDYTLHIKPLYPDMSLDAKIVEFRTKSPAADGAENNLNPVNAEAGDGQMIYVSWSPVQCAEFYEIFQLVSTGGDWELVQKTSESSAALAGVPCKEYRYGVAVTIDGVRSPIMEAGSPVMTNLDNSVAFKAPNLEVDPTENGAVLTWDHGACIPSYVVRVCPTVGDLVCEEFTVIRDSNVHNITHEVNELKPCSQYSLEILPQIDGQEFEPDKITFKTEFPVPTPPADFSAAYRKGAKKLEFEWSEVECSSGYKLVEGEENEVVWETEDPRQLFTVINKAEPCRAYSYGIVAMVGGEMSEASPMQEIVVPPRFGILDRPSIEVLDNVNDTINFVFNKAASNGHCKVEYYELRYSSLKSADPQEMTVYPEDLDEDTRISISFPGASGPGLNLEGRIKYVTHDTTTAWIQSQNPQIMSNGIGGGSSILVPIIIGILVGIVVLVIIVFFLVKKKRNQNKYDAEKANSDKDETQKLNADVPDS